MPAVDTASAAPVVRSDTAAARNAALAKLTARLTPVWARLPPPRQHPGAGYRRPRTPLLSEAYGKAYAGMGEASAGRNATTLERSRVAGSASMVGVGEAYAKANAARTAAARERSNAATAARYAAAGEAYSKATAWPANAANAAALERSNAAAAARGAAMAQYYAHGSLMLDKPAVGNGSVTSKIAPAGVADAAIDAATLDRRAVAADVRNTAMGKADAGRTATSEKHVPGGGQ